MQLPRTVVVPVTEWNGMPLLEPIPISTKGKSWWEVLKIWALEKREWMVMKDYFYITSHFSFYIPKGFVYDGASIPRFFWWLLSPVGLLLIPALYHDFAYENGFVFSVSRMAWNDAAYVSQVPITRKEADDGMRALAIDVNGIAGPADIAWAGVRIGGFVGWNNHEKEREALINQQK